MPSGAESADRSRRNTNLVMSSDKEKEKLMKFGVSVLTVALVSAFMVAGVTAAPPGAVRGTFTQGWLASSAELSKHISGSDVWCRWQGDHVQVHVTVRNRSVERVEATIKPRYYLRGGGEHGSSFFGAKQYKINARSSRSITMDAGKPKGVSGRVPIRKCEPLLYLLGSG